MPIPITGLSDDQLDNVEANYRQKNLTEGGPYTLAEVLLEKRHRRPSAFGVREVATKIIELAAASPDRLVTYGQLWDAFRPGTPWQGHKTQKIVRDSLYRVIGYCVANKLPILTTLVVRAATRELSNEAVENIANECRELGVHVGHDPKAFVNDQMRKARAVLPGQLPADRS